LTRADIYVESTTVQVMVWKSVADKLCNQFLANNVCNYDVIKLYYPWRQQLVS